MKNMGAKEKGVAHKALSEIINNANIKQQEQSIPQKNEEQYMR